MSKPYDVFSLAKSKRSLYFLCALQFAAFVAMGTLGISFLGNEGKYFSDLKTNNLSSMIYLTESERAMNSLKYASRDFFELPENQRELSWVEDRASIEKINTAMGKYAPLADTELERAEFKNWKEHFARFLERRPMSFELAQAGRHEEANAFRSQHLAKQADLALDSLLKLQKFQSDEANVKEQLVESSIGQYSRIILLFLLSGAILIVAAAAYSLAQLGEAEMRDAEIQRLKIEAMGRMAAVGEIAGNIAHEIGKPLAVVREAIEEIEDVLLDETPDPEIIKMLSGSASSESKRISKIVAGLSTFSQDGSSEPIVGIDFKKFLEETLAITVHKMKQSSVKLISDPVPEGLEVMARQAELSQVIVNLLINSVDTISNLREKWIRVDVIDLRNQIEISITDSGYGIPELDHASLFSQSYTTKSNTSGIGLGLGTCRRIIESYGGRLSIDAECKNTKFVVRLPKAAEADVARTIAYAA